METVNEKVWEKLKKAFENEKLSQAYLFCGPKGVGKFEMILNFVFLINNIDDEKEKKKITLNQNPDVIIVKPEIEKKKDKVRKKDIPIGEMREVIKKMNFFAYQEKYKILIIDEAERLTLSAANSLLKIIEEPPKDTIIILNSNQKEKIIPTIRSRSQTVYFGITKLEAIRSFLKMKFPDKSSEEIKASARLSRGRVKIAEECLLDENRREKIEQAVLEFRNALRGGVIAGFDFSEKFSKNKDELITILDECENYLLDFLKQNISDKADARVTEKVLKILKSIGFVKKEIAETNTNQKLQLENFFVQL